MSATSNSIKYTTDQSQYVEVNIWLAKDKNGKTTTSSEGGRQLDAAARCGHVSLTILFGKDQTKEIAYVSFWPGSTKSAVDKQWGYGKLLPPRVGVLEKDIYEDIKNEGGLPDVIVRLHNLDVKNMMKHLSSWTKLIGERKITWVLAASVKNDISNGARKASCASLAYNLLKKGGFNMSLKDRLELQKREETPKTSSYMYVCGKGPEDREFYNLTRCNDGDILWGWFNLAPWVESFFSPKAMLLRAAHAASLVPDDKNSTTKIMKSNRVAPRGN